MATPPPVFRQSGSSDLYWLDTSTTAGFLASPGAGLGAAPTLPQTWADRGGVFVFLGAAPVVEDDFLRALKAYLSGTAPVRPRFVWVHDPNLPMLQWTIESVVTSVVDGVEKTAQTKSFMVFNWTLVVTRGAVLSVGESSTEWGFQLEDPAIGPAIQLLAPLVPFPARPSSSRLAMDAALAGCWSYAIDAPAPAGGPDVFDRLQCGIWYFRRDPDSRFVRTAAFPVLTQPPTVALSLNATFDPVRPFVPQRTGFAFSAATALNSGFATAMGYGVNLTPVVQGTATAMSARLAFGRAPVYVGGAGRDDSGFVGAVTEADPTELYTCPAGSFEITTLDPALPSGDIERFLCGASALEYLGLPAATGSNLIFTPGNPAFAPLDPAATTTDARLTSVGTTSWVFAEPSAGSARKIAYYAQPPPAPLFNRPVTHDAVDLDALELLDFLEIPSVDLGEPAKSSPFPLAPFRGLDPHSYKDALDIEQAALAPSRAEILGAASTARPPTADATSAPTVAVTPAGTAAGVTTLGEPWAWVALGQNAVSASEPDLVFTSVSGKFRHAMLTKDLFMVLGKADALAGQASVRYQLGKGDLTLIGKLPPDRGVPKDVLDRVRTYFKAANYPRYETLTKFQEALAAASPGISPAQKLVFQRFAGLLTAEIAEWSFQLSPEHWTNPDRTDGSHPYIVYKLVDGRTLIDLVHDQTAWSWPEAASAKGPAEAAKEIGALVDKAIARAKAAADSGGPPSPYAHFAAIAQDEHWTGILAFSVDVPLDQLPDELQVLAAGIDPDSFYAHHVGLSVTPFAIEDSKLSFKRSSWFGLLDYETEEHQFYSEEIPFAFKVLKLTVGFENSVITTFSSRVELLVNRLFGSQTRMFPTDHGNNVILDGSYQKQSLPDGTTHDAYVFAMNGYNEFLLGSAAVDRVELLSTELIASKAAAPAQGVDTVEATFQMTGNLRFLEPAGFDPLCWGKAGDSDGYLRFGNLAVVMRFDLADPAGTTVFELRDGNLSFDLANSVARVNSLVHHFPVQLAGLVTTPDPLVVPKGAGVPAPTPADMGYVSVSAPLQQSEMTQPWYGLHYTVDLGTLGALAGGSGLSLDILAAWNGGASMEPELFLGVKLPGVKDVVGPSFPLEGLLNVGFKSIAFLVGKDEKGATKIALLARDFAIRFLGLAFPPGRNELYLFGNPLQASDKKAGWYAAYESVASDKKTSSAVRDARAVGRTSPAQELS